MVIQHNKTNSKEQLQKKQIPYQIQVFTKSTAKIAINFT